MKFFLTVNMDNAAFAEADGEVTREAVGVELARILRELAIDVQNGVGAGETGAGYDSNGNMAGKWAITS